MIQVWNYVAFACMVVTTLGGAGVIIIAVIKWLKKPDTTRDETLKKHDELLDNDNKRLKVLEERQRALEEGNKVLMKSMLALMSHEIDGNHAEELKLARDDLQEYLIRR
jgi:hypothetical protein